MLVNCGKAINITRTSIAHSISYPLTAKYRIPHGLACSFTIPRILKFASEDIVLTKTFISLKSFTINKLQLPKKIRDYLDNDKFEIPYEFLYQKDQKILFLKPMKRISKTL